MRGVTPVWAEDTRYTPVNLGYVPPFYSLLRLVSGGSWIWRTRARLLITKHHLIRDHAKYQHLDTITVSVQSTIIQVLQRRITSTVHVREQIFMIH